MRIEATRFGVKTSKTIRRAANGATNSALHNAQAAAVIHSQKSQPQIQLVNGKLMKSKHNFEKVDKNERKRQLTEQSNLKYSHYHEEDEEEDELFDEQEQYMVEIVDDRKSKKNKRQYESEEDDEETKSESGEEEEKSQLNDWLQEGTETEQKEIRDLVFELATLQR